MKKNNKGFSLVELIVIIAILAVLMGAVITYIGSLGTAQAKKCANGINSGFSQTKVCAMSRSSASMIVYCNDEGAFLKTIQGSTDRVEKIGTAGTVVEYRTVRDSNSFVPVGETEATGVKIEFDRASGACKKMSSGDYCYGFKVTCGKTTYIVSIEPLTGRAMIQ